MKALYFAGGAALLSIFACSAPTAAADPLVLTDVRWVAEPASGKKGAPRIRIQHRKSSSDQTFDGSRSYFAKAEVALSRGKGNLILTGKLGDVMQESARAALSYVRSRAELFGLDPDFHASLDIHIHVPEGAIPKDGPSAGITMATALLSAVTRIPVHRDLAMTGEITLRGKVLPVGGVKDKVLAAARAGITRVILPAENERDLDDIPSDVRERMEFTLVESMDEVMTVALDGTIVPLAAKEKLPEPEKVVGPGAVTH